MKGGDGGVQANETNDWCLREALSERTGAADAPLVILSPLTIHVPLGILGLLSPLGLLGILGSASHHPFAPGRVARRNLPARASAAKPRLRASPIQMPTAPRPAGKASTRAIGSAMPQ